MGSAKKTNVVSIAFIYLIGSFFSQGLRFLVLPIFSRLMTPADYGLVGSYEIWISILSVLIGLQTSSSVANAYLDYGEENVSKYTSATTTVGILSFIVFLMGTALFQKQLAALFEINGILLILGNLQCLFSYMILMLTAKYRILERPLGFIVFSISYSVLSIGSSIVAILLLSVETYLAYAIGTVSAAIIVGIFAFLRIYADGKCLFNIDMAKYGLLFSVPLILHALASIIVSRTGQMLLLKFMNSEEAGIYNFANNFGIIINGLYTAFNQAYIPWYYKQLQAQNIDHVKRCSLKYIELFTLVVMGVMMSMPEVIKLMGTEGYYRAIYVVPIIMAGMYNNFLYTFPVNYEFYNKKTQFIAAGTMILVGVNLVINVILVPKFGVYGAALTTYVSSMILLVIHLIIAKKAIKAFELEYKNFVCFQVLVSIFVTGYYFIVDAWIIRWSIIVMLVILFFQRALKFKKSYL